MPLNLDYKRIIFAILLAVLSIGMIFGVFWLVFLRTPGGEGDEIGALPLDTATTGVLPGTGTGGETNIAGSGGSLPDNISRLLPDKDIEIDELELDQIAKGSLTEAEVVTDEEIKNAVMINNGFNYLSRNDNRFYRLSLGGQDAILLSQKDFPYTEEVTWSPDGNKVILEYPDGANIIYDFTRNKRVTMPRGVEDPSWQKGSEEIAYKYIGSSEDDNWLLVSSIDGTNLKSLEPLGDQGNNVQVSWSPTSQVVAMYHKPIGLNKEEVFFIGLNNENFKSLTVKGSGFTGIWSPDGTKILYHVVDADSEYKPVIWIADGYGDNIGQNNYNLGLQTWVDKCVFADNRYVYCAVPTELPEGVGLYPDLLNEAGDVFYRIDLETGISKLIAYPVLSEDLEEFQAGNLFISDKQDKLYFRDEFTDKLYYLRLK